MGVFHDKEYDRIAEILCPLASSVYTVQLPDKKRGLPPEELAETVRRYCPHVTAVHDGNNDMAAADTGRSNSVSKAVAMALAEAGKGDVILAFGSLSYLKQAEDAYTDTAAKARDRAGASGAPCQAGAPETQGSVAVPDESYQVTEQMTNRGRELS